MEISEICESFRLAKNKKEQLFILVDLTATDTETIIEILKDHGLYIKRCKCRKCSEMFNKFLSPYCDTCQIRVAMAKENDKKRKEYVMKIFYDNEAKRQDYLAKAKDLREENKRLLLWL